MQFSHPLLGFNLMHLILKPNEMHDAVEEIPCGVSSKHLILPQNSMPSTLIVVQKVQAPIETPEHG